MFYEVAACNKANYRYFGDWQDLTPDQQAFIIAQYIMNNLVTAHQQDAEIQQMKAKQAKK